MPGIITSDVIKADWHDYEIDVTRPWPFESESIDGLVLLDVLHHVYQPARLFDEALRALRPDGRMALLEPYVSPLSFPVYRFLHHEGLDTSIDPFQPNTAQKDPLEGNQSLPQLIFGRHRTTFERCWPRLKIADLRLYSGFSYVASGGLRHKPLVPMALWSWLFNLDRNMPGKLCKVVAFRMLVTLSKVGFGP